MNMIRISVCLVLALAAPLLAFADDAKDEMKKLEGAWKVATAEIDGNPFDGKQFGMNGLVIANGKLNFQNDGKTIMAFTFTVDPSKKPTAMDWVKDKESMTLPTIYLLEGDALKLCMPLLPKKGSGDKIEIKRPESFDTKGKPVMTMMLKREKK
jgi:uncharacterized protein (TIGR03067 family)